MNHDAEIKAVEDKYLEMVGAIMENFDANDVMTGNDNLALVGARRGLVQARKIRELMLRLLKENL